MRMPESRSVRLRPPVIFRRLTTTKFFRIALLRRKPQQQLARQTRAYVKLRETAPSIIHRSRYGRVRVNTKRKHEQISIGLEDRADQLRQYQSTPLRADQAPASFDACDEAEQQNASSYPARSKSRERMLVRNVHRSLVLQQFPRFDTESAGNPRNVVD